MTPVAFEGCFGWFHPGGTSRGAVLCGPVGEEADYVYASWRELADRLAGAGFSTLRFDYPGLYNSLDLDESRDPPTAWIESIKAAIAWLKKEAVLDDVVLIGLRFGAGLALKCAEELGGVATLVLMAPIVSGVAYQRELSLLAKLSEGATAIVDREGPHRAATLFTAEQTFAVEGLRCCQSGARPAARVLILSESTTSSSKALAERLRARGSETEEQRFHGYPELMVRPEWSRYPEVAFGKVIEWLQGDASSESGGASPAATVHLGSRAKLFPPGALEVAIEFREERPLFGIQCLPDYPREGRPGVIFLDTSATPQGGMNRQWVSMARRLAVLGFTSLRFDFHGVGDSSLPFARPLREPSIREARVDVIAAISHLRTLGCSRIALVGFCWGAQLAYNVAIADDRVSDLILINARRQFWDIATDNHSRPTFSTQLRYLRDSATWESFRRDASLLPIARFGLRLTMEAVKAAHGRLVNADTTRKNTILRVRALKARGTRTLLAQGNGDSFLAEFEDYFGVRRQALGALLDVDTRFFDGVSHRFSAQENLSELMQVVADQLSVSATDPPPGRGAPCPSA